MLVVGVIEEEPGHFFNTAIVLKDRRRIGRYRKKHLPAAEHGYTPGDDCRSSKPMACASGSASVTIRTSWIPPAA